MGVAVAPLEVSITSSGALAPSRLEKLMFVLLPVLKPKLQPPFPVMYTVTSTLVHVPAVYF
jgi:hypothetical protein